MFWSTRNPRIRVKYTCRIKEIRPNEISNNLDSCPNVTTVHEVLHGEEEEGTVKVSGSLDYTERENVSKLNSSKNEDSSFESIDSIPNAVMDDVIKVVHRLIKKVIKKQKNYWGKVRSKFSTQSDKVSFSAKNTYLDHSNVNEYVAKANTGSSQESLNSKQFGNKINEMLYGIDKNSDFKENVTCFHDDSIKSSAFISKNNNERNHGQFKNCYPEILKKYILTSKLKQLKKKLKYCSLHKQNFEISEKLMNIMSNKEIAKEVTDFLLKRYRKGGDLPPKLASLLESALPPCSVNETVFPVFISSKENSGINESSGYSSNEDSHLRPPMRSQNAAVCVSRSENKSQGEIALKSNAKQRAAENDKCELSWMKDIKLNGRKDFNQNIGSSSSRTNNVEALEHSVNRLKGLNGISQNTGPHKCTKCKRLYRTNESFEKHCESCNFFVDSSSTEEESSDSSDGSDESYESSSDENIPKELNRISLKQPIPSSIDKNFTTNKHFTNSIVNNSISNVCYKSGILNKKQVEGNLTSSPKVQSSHANSSRIQSNHISSSTIQSSHTNSPRMQSSHTKIPRTQSNQKGNSLKSSFKGKSVPLKSYGSVQNNINPNQYQQTQNLNIRYQQTSNSVPTIQYGTVAATSDRMVPNIPINIDNAAFNSGVLPSNFNVGFSNSVPPGLVQLPCNTVIMPQAPEPSQPILQVPQNSFFNAPLELAPGAQLSYVGSVTVTNNDTMTFQLNMPDQIMPIFPQPNINFTQPTIIPSSIQMQQTGIQLSTFNLQQLSLQGAFTTNQVVFPQEGVNMPQNQVYLIGDPVSHPLPSNSQAPNFVFQVPVSQSENSFIPPQQFVNPMTFNSNAQNLIDNTMPELPKKPVSLENNAQRSDCMPELKPQIVTNNNSNQRTMRHGTFINSPMASPEPAYSPTCIRSNSTASSSCTTTPSVSNRSTPVPDSQSAPLSLTSNSKIMEFLKKAAEQVLSLSEKRKAQSQEQNADSGAPEKKTRFAHTRKVAARRAEKLKLQKTGPSSVNKPKTVHLNIATLKTIPLPVVPIINEFSEMNQPQAPSLEVPPPQSPSPVIDGNCIIVFVSLCV